jgi:hypothetical protein
VSGSCFRLLAILSIKASPAKAVSICPLLLVLFSLRASLPRTCSPVCSCRTTPDRCSKRSRPSHCTVTYERILYIFVYLFVYLFVCFIIYGVQMRSFQSGVGNLKHDQSVETTTYLLARDEDCENSFHSTADFVSLSVLLFCMAFDDSCGSCSYL